MKKYILSLGALFLATTNVAFANMISSEYLDIAPTDGQVDTIRVEFSEDVTACDYEVADWNVTTPGDINVTAVTGLSCTMNDEFLEINIAADTGITGGTTAPQVTYTDGGNGSLDMASGSSGNLAITPLDKAAPFILSPNGGASPYNFHINENSTTIALFTFTVDSDNGALSLLDWGGDATKFNTVGTVGSGNTRNNVTFNFENPTDVNHDGTYTFNIRAYDDAGTVNPGGGVDNGSAVMVVNVTVDDVDEAPHGGLAHPAAKDEDVAIGTVFYDVNNNATSSDLDEDGDVITYTFSSGNTNNDFAIDANTGIITSIHALDYETTDVYTLYVEGSSMGTSGVAQTANFTVILNINEVEEGNATPIYRLYNKRTGAQLYTKGTTDRDKILNKYSDFEFTDGSPAFYASTSDDGNTPIYRLYNTRTGAQLYTKGIADRDKVLNKYSDFEFTDGSPAFYASTSDDGNTPIYRLYNTRTGAQLYTKGEVDRDKILNKFSDFEFTDGSPAFYASLTL